MKSFVSIFLLCYFSLAAFVPQMDIDRLHQLPNFVAHFFEHQEESGDDDLGFIEFINIHYGQESQQPSDGHELPFKKHDCSISSHTFVTFSPGSEPASEIPSTELKESYSFQFTSQHIFDIWHPPRA